MHFFLSFLFFIGQMLYFSSSHASTICGTISSQSGEVSFSPRSRGVKGKKLGTQKILTGTKISTGPNSNVHIELPGINTLTIEPGTKLQITKCKFNKKKLSTYVEIRLDKGEFSAKAITKSSRASVNFIVKTNHALIETAQAEFAVLHDDLTRKSEVHVEKGMIQLSARKKNAKSGTIEVSSGEIGYVYVGQDPEKNSKASDTK